MTDAPTPYTVVGGYLGAGKTTLLNQLIRESSGRRLAVIVNDFGDLGIDADLIAGNDGDTISLANGCICCSLSDGLANVLHELRQRSDTIDHVVVEASGVSDPVRIGNYGRPFGFELRGVIVLADAEQVRARASDKYVGETVVSQLGGADMLVLTKVDLVDEKTLDEVRDWLRERAPDVPILESSHGKLSTAIVLGEIETTDVAMQPDGAPHASDYDAWSVTRSTSVTRARLDSFLDALPERVLRAKGFVHLTDDPDHRYVLQVVGRRSSLARGEPWNDEVPTTRLVIIGAPGSLGQWVSTPAATLFLDDKHGRITGTSSASRSGSAHPATSEGPCAERGIDRR